jgi:hypothetical protein
MNVSVDPIYSSSDEVINIFHNGCLAYIRTRSDGRSAGQFW